MMTKYLIFSDVTSHYGERRKTRVFRVVSKSTGEPLATIKWWPAWRQYCFFPEQDTLFNKGCLDDIREFFKTLSEKRA